MIRDPDHLGLYQTESGRWVLRQLVPEKLRAAAKRRFNISREFLVRLGDNRESAVRRLEAARAAARQSDDPRRTWRYLRISFNAWRACQHPCPQADDDYPVEGGVGLAVSSSVEPVPG
ncbi:MAG: hypothetical protein K2X00_18545, partial [Nitrospiraceae bacterium]|nr:hypothetical protein [Nitrospiraceae bacterium]